MNRTLQDECNEIADRIEYENWPRWVRIAYFCTFPVSCPVLMLSMMLGTIAAGPVVLIYLTITSRKPQENPDV